MRILLLGDFSSLHLNLKEGLCELGHEVVLVSSGDGFKKIPADIDFSSSLPGYFGKVKSKILNPLLSLNQLKGFDIVQLMNPFLFYHFFPSNYFFNKIIKNNGKFFMLAAGSDAFYWKYGRPLLDYGPFDDFLKYDKCRTNYYMETKKALRFNYEMVTKSCGIIPVMYEYEVSYRSVEKVLPTIPLPINLNKVKFTRNVVGEKLVVFHGLSRYGFKGTRHVEKAFKYLNEKYPNKLDLIIKGNMPLVNYLKLMSKTNIVIDQLNSYSSGVNGIYALAMGKVVLGGAEPESLASLGVKSSPIINLKPCSKSIIEAIESLLYQKDKIESIGLSSREFAERVHGHISIAEKYIKAWKSQKRGL